MRKLMRVNVIYVVNGRNEKVYIEPRNSKAYKDLGYKVVRDFEFVEYIDE